MMIDLLGYAAGLLVLTSIIPQVVKSWRTELTRDLSLSRYVIYVCGIILWLLYAVLIGNIPMILSNSAALLLASVLLYLKITHG
mgnify:CR=1 FL=1